MLEMYHPSQLETKYGGSAPNNDSGPYWPPNQPPSTEYGHDPKKIMSEVKYREVIDKHAQEIKVDPAILEEKRIAELECSMGSDTHEHSNSMEKP